MNKVKTLIAVLALVVVALGAAQTGGAAPPQSTVGGGFEAPPMVTGVRLAGDNVFLQQFVSNTMTGTLNGTVDGQIRATLHPNTNADFHGRMTFTGSTPCGVGTIVFAVQGTGTVAPPTTFAFDVHFTSISGAGSLANAHAVLDAAYVGFGYTYTGRIHCT